MLLIFSYLALISIPAMASAAGGQIDVWWPTKDTSLQGTQPFKALLSNASIGQYQMFWQVDGGNSVPMYDSYSDYPHKEAIVNLTGWNWKGSGPYVLTFTAKDPNGTVLAQENRSIYIPSSAPQQVSIVQAAQSPIAKANPLAGKKLYVNPASYAKTQADAWKYSRPSDSSIMSKAAEQPQAIWLGSWMNDSETAKTITSTLAAAQAQGSMPIFVAYNIPLRDCGSYSAGGANNQDGYKAWIRTVAGAIGNGSASIILEPDALAQASCLSADNQSARLSLLKDAVSVLKSHSGISVYVDAGHPGWVPASQMAAKLVSAGISAADGFSLNVSNFISTGSNASYGTDISTALKALGVQNDTHFVIDTSRNGTGGNGQWCNPNGQALGSKPSATTGNSLIDAFLWIKSPGESDGTCNGGPSAGTWWPDYALDLAKRASY